MRQLFNIPDKLKLPKADFNNIVEDQIKHIRKTLESKGAEYAPGGDDAMHNFNVTMAIKQASSGKSVNREQVVWDMAQKHFTSIMDMIFYRMDLNPDSITLEQIHEKFGDIINYFILIKASMMHSLQIQTNELPFPNPALQDVMLTGKLLEEEQWSTRKTEPVSLYGDAKEVKRLADHLDCSTDLLHKTKAFRDLKTGDIYVTQDGLEIYSIPPATIMSQNFLFKRNK